ncbi:hypothetical protein Lfu02_01570 [Longispora fulva]|uniref:Ribosomal protein S27AE n=1 Tax=Longispora fulva TaxID=619741 RepID=A0A8J7GQ43_9ACTN|nr:ribosomal protein S27AE [Longispora fulva]GIG55785.1 hypothetical protein Lfu02_01570 [Longispora fulva]
MTFPQLHHTRDLGTHDRTGPVTCGYPAIRPPNNAEWASVRAVGAGGSARTDPFQRHQMPLASEGKEGEPVARWRNLCPRCATPLHRHGECRACEIAADPAFVAFARAQARVAAGAPRPGDPVVITDYLVAVKRAEGLAASLTTGCSRCGRPLWDARHSVGGSHDYQRPSERTRTQRAWAHQCSREGRLHIVAGVLYLRAATRKSRAR